LASAAILVACFLPICRAWASDISIRSGEDVDTVIIVGPNAGPDAPGTIRMESDPDNGTLMQATPPRKGDDGLSPSEPIIIIPEIHVRGKK